MYIAVDKFSKSDCDFKAGENPRVCKVEKRPTYADSHILNKLPDGWWTLKSDVFEHMNEVRTHPPAPPLNSMLRKINPPACGQKNATSVASRDAPLTGQKKRDTDRGKNPGSFTFNIEFKGGAGGEVEIRWTQELSRFLVQQPLLCFTDAPLF